MVTALLLRRSLRRLHAEAESDPVPGELRGWSYHSPPVKPRAYLGLGVSEVAYGAACGWRQLWLRRRGVEQPRTPAMEAGIALHEAVHAAAVDVRLSLARGERPWAAASRLLAGARGRLRGLPGWAVEVYRALVLAWLGEAAGHELHYGGEGAGWLPWLSEYRVDGYPLGLSRALRADALGEAGVVVEVKLGRPQWWHKLALAGYALALESMLEAPFDYGVLLSVTLNGGRPRFSVEPVYVSPRLREDFLAARDEAVDALLSGVEPEDRCNGNGLGGGGLG
ncbi:type I-A CRISPR-associated protein Cas4/Csa1 [Stetteria hydrogenophila]